jgi:hypothetical protein
MGSIARTIFMNEGMNEDMNEGLMAIISFKG